MRPELNERKEFAMSNKMVKCKACNADIAKTAKTCPTCGAKNKKKHPILGGILIVLGIIILISAMSGGGEDNEPQKVGEVEASTPAPTPSEAVQTEFGVGEVVELNDIIVTLTNVSENTGSQFMSPTDGNVFLVCEFEIENNSDKDIVVSSMLCFEAYVDDYATTMSISAMTSVDTAQLDGTVAAGKKMRGVIGYEAPSDWSELEVRFTPDFWTGKDITFVATK